MKKLVIEGQHELTGEIKISGAKNSTVALIPAAILSDEKVLLTNVPEITDTYALIDIMELLNCRIDFKEEQMLIDTTKAQNKMIPKSILLFYGRFTKQIQPCRNVFPRRV